MTMKSTVAAFLLAGAVAAGLASGVSFDVGEKMYWTFHEAGEIRMTCFWLSFLFGLAALFVYFEKISEQLLAGFALIIVAALVKPPDLLKRRAHELIYPRNEQISSLMMISDVPTEGLQNYRRFVLNFNRALSVVVARVKSGTGIDFAGEPGDVIGQSLELYGRGISKINSDPTVQKARDAAGALDPSAVERVESEEKPE